MRETRETRAVREQEEALKKAEFRASLPLRMLNLLMKATQLGYANEVVPDDSGAPSIRISFPGFDQSGNRGRDVTEVLTLNEDPWQAEHVESEFERVAAAQAERERLLKLSKDTLAGLSEDQRKALRLTGV